MTDKANAYKEWQEKLAEIRRVREQYITVGDYKPGEDIKSPEKALSVEALQELKRLEDEAEALHQQYRAAE